MSRSGYQDIFREFDKSKVAKIQGLLPSDFTRILLMTRTREYAFTHNRGLNGLSAAKSDNN